MVNPPTKLRVGIFSVALLAMASACEHGVLAVDYDATSSTTPGAASGSGYANPSGGGGAVGDNGQTGTEPELGGGPGGSTNGPQAPPPMLHNATFGERCVGGETIRYLVLADAVSDCATDATRIDTANTSGEVVGATIVALDGTDGPRSFTYCAQPGSCQQITLDMTIDDQGTAVTGSWAGAPDGQQRTIQFAAESCAYDDAAAPLPGDTLAAGISVAEVSVYQGVKIPVVQGGELVADRNAPIIAGRPGLVRVFVEPQGDWEPREIIARLTVGDLVKEETFSPAAASSEMEGESTANFTFEAGELPAGADFSVELIEAQSCASVAGEVAVPRVPETDVAPLQSTALNNNMKIMLVPIQYDGDGSGRLPNLDQAAIDRFKAEAFTHFPVPDIELTVREPVASNIGMAPNGAGFGQMLNFCLNVRANDNPPDDTYYYCVIQPANSSQAFCGGGCVAGVAPVPGANDIGARGGIGISFNGDGEGVFVHEVGHALGRPHSPCGGASGADQGYPYSQGRIGSWGYDIMTGRLFEPTQRADFMGYCNPAWVSDYTYEKIFDRLDTVIGSQQFQVGIPPTQFKTAVVEGNGDVSWGDDITLTRMPTGVPIRGTMHDQSGRLMGQPEVFTTPVADIDAVLVRVEDPGVAGATIDVPGLGELQLP